MSMLRELEDDAGITDRDAFWLPYAELDRGGGIHMHNGKMVSAGFKAGVRELQRLAIERQAAARTCTAKGGAA